MKILSLGAGVQSTTLLLMMIRGEMPRVDHCIFSDTGWESKETYDHLDWLTEQAATAGIPVHKATYGNLKEDMLKGWVINDSKAIGHSFGSVPFFVTGKDGKPGMLPRQCTSKYKILPVERKIKELLGVKTFAEVEPGSVWQYFGISSDEVQRTRTSDKKACKFFYPFIFNNSTSDKPLDWRRPGITRNDCLNWCEKNGYPRPPRSACIGCPFHSNAEWRMIKADPEKWADVCEFDRLIRHPSHMSYPVFLHSSRVPLAEADLGEDDGRQGMIEECQGMCGL